LNGHTTVRFDGVNQYGVNAIIPIPQPATYYAVFKQITWTANRSIFDSNGGIQHYIQQNAISPNLKCYAGALSLDLNPALALNTYGIVTCVFNGANSEFRNNNNASQIGNFGNNNLIGLALANFDNAGNNGNCEWSYLIIRSAADNTSTQNLFINYLKNRFAL